MSASIIIVWRLLYPQLAAALTALAFVLSPVGGGPDHPGVCRLSTSQLPLDHVRPSGLRSYTRACLLPGSRLRDIPGNRQRVSCIGPIYLLHLRVVNLMASSRRTSSLL